MKNYKDFQGGESVWKSIEKWHFWGKEGLVCRRDLGAWMLFIFLKELGNHWKILNQEVIWTNFCFRQIILAKCGLWFEGWNGNGGKGD